MINQFMHNLKEVHLQVTHQVLEYLKGTSRKDILLKTNKDLVLEAYKMLIMLGQWLTRYQPPNIAPFWC